MAQSALTETMRPGAVTRPTLTAGVGWIGLAFALIILLGGVALQAAAGYFYDDNSGHAWGSDDAYISYRYAQNLAEGNGLVYNPGERVEGYSNFLYVLLIAPAFFFTTALGVYYYSVALNTLFATLALILFHQHMRRRLGDEVAAVGALLFALLPAVWVWTAAGLETPLVLLLQIALWVSAERLIDEGETPRRIALLSVLTVLSVLARADGFITPAIAFVYLLLRGQRRATLIVGAALVATVVAQVAFRLAYYGYPLPNTYYVKVSGSLFLRIKAAVKQLILHTPRMGVLPYLMAIAVLAMSAFVDVTRDWRAALSHLRFDLFFSVGWLAYFIYIGGDTFDERFLLILMCLGFVIMFQAGQQFRPARQLIFTLVPLLLVYQAAPLLLDPRYDYRPQKYDRWVTLGEFLAEEYPGATLAIDGAGKTPFISGLYTIDMLGLNEEYIAHQAAVDFRNPGHNKYNPYYVFSRQPDVIASWLVPYSVDMTWGLLAERYTAEGYWLAYLVNSSPVSLGEDNILNAASLTPEEISALTVNGYEYGVLVRER